jgi:hypothetical protein
MLKEADGKIYDIMGTRYQVTTSIGRSRRMILADEDQITDLNAK